MRLRHKELLGSYMQATNLLPSGMPPAITAGGPLSERLRVSLGNGTTGGSLVAHRLPAYVPTVVATRSPLAFPSTAHQRTTSGLRVWAGMKEN